MTIDSPTHGHSHALGDVPVLDIGGDIGAVLVYLDGDTESGELFACPTGRPDAHFHTGVHHRHQGEQTAYIALFAEVAAGAYELLDHERRPFRSFKAIGGQVVEIDLRSNG